MDKDQPLRDANHLAIDRAAEKMLRGLRLRKARKIASLRRHKRIHAMLAKVRMK